MLTFIPTAGYPAVTQSMYHQGPERRMTDYHPSSAGRSLPTEYPMEVDPPPVNGNFHGELKPQDEYGDLPCPFLQMGRQRDEGGCLAMLKQTTGSRAQHTQSPVVLRSPPLSLVALKSPTQAFIEP